MTPMLPRFFQAIALVVLIIHFPTMGSAQPPPPTNDECSGATVITSLPFHAAQDTRLATPNASDPILLCADSGGGKTVWYTYTPDSTRYVTFTTDTSQPSTYDIAMALYTGSCGSLVEVECNDDINPGVNRQAEIASIQVFAGVTYTLQIAEWNGGGPSGGVPTGGDLYLDVTIAGPPPPITKGPKVGTLLAGDIVSTSGFENVPFSIMEKGEIENEPDIPLLPTPDDVMPPKGPPGSNYIEDRPNALPPPSSKPAVLTNFRGINSTGAFPPDPIMAVGPNHIVAMVNSRFQIWDKSGNLLKVINLAPWFAGAVPPGAGVGFSDPEVIYDHFANRWVMTGGDFSDTAHLLISVSDDDDPLGTWYNWALPAGLGDSLTGNLPDYPQLGYDSLAIYLTTREFGASFYSRVRIIEKSQLYANTAGPVTWTDFWDIREPQHTTVVVDGIRPSEIHGTPGVHFLVASSPYTLGTFFSVWTIHDPIGSPSLTGSNVPVVQFNSAPNPGQLGGGIAIEGGGRAIRHRAIYRDSSLWSVHSIASGTGNAYSALHYVRLNPFTNANLEDVAMGVENYWHFYPALMINENEDLMMVFTRSGTTEYPGVFLAGRKSTDPLSLSSSVLVKAGVANYQLLQDPLGSPRNRWGDYLGIGLDPADGASFWAIGEFAAGSSSWGTWITKTQMAPVAGKAIYATPGDFSFGEAEINHVGDTLVVYLTNNGLDTLVISSLTSPDSNFAIVDPPTLPLSIATFAVDSLKVRFNPKAVGDLSSTLDINSNDTYSPTVTINLVGPGFHVVPAVSSTMYGGTGVSDQGRLITIDPITAAGTAVGVSGEDEFVSLAIHPTSREILGLAPEAATYQLVRVNSEAGDAHHLLSIPFPILKGMAIRDDTVFIGRINGIIYRVDLGTGIITQAAATGLKLAGLAVNPVSGELWASIQVGAPTDRIFKVDLATGASTLVGRTNLNVPTLDIAFDGQGNLFGLIGNGNIYSNLILIDTLTGSGTIVGDVGIKPTQSLAIDPDAVFPVHSFRFASDWNLFSVPVLVPSYATSSLFPSAVSKAFAYDGKYVERDTMTLGYGYWLRFNSTYVKSVIGTPFDDDSVDLKLSWNLIGSVSDPVLTSTINTDPPGLVNSAYYTYEGGGYSPSDTIVPGFGYWVRSTGTGKLVLNASSIVPKTEATATALEMLKDFSYLTVRDATGNRQQLYFGTAERGDVNSSMYDLPPASPAGLDARFSSNRMLEVHPSRITEAIDFPVRISAASSPVALGWHISESATTEYSLVVTNKQTGKTNTRLIKGEGNVVVWNPDISDVKIRVSGNLVPSQFALRQNYPNPFNPSTDIRYQLPVTSYLTLKVYDIIGKEVTTLVDGRQEAGYYTVPFVADHLSSGVYFYRLTTRQITAPGERADGPAGAFTSVQKMLLLK